MTNKGESILGKSIRSWVNVREYPSDGKSEDSYILHKCVERVSMVENEDETISVLVHALGSTFLVSVLGTLPDAQGTRELSSINH
jgi:hypothetical protein